MNTITIEQFNLFQIAPVIQAYISAGRLTVPARTNNNNRDMLDEYGQAEWTLRDDPWHLSRLSNEVCI